MDVGKQDKESKHKTDSAKTPPRKSKKQKSQSKSMSKKSLELLHENLSESAQKLFARMSFFPGGLFRGFNDLWELLGDGWEDAAEEIADHELAQYDKSRDRYIMVRPAMKYAQEKLNESEGDDFRHEAASFWAEFVQWYDLMLDVQLTDQKVEINILVLPNDPEERQNELESLQSNSFGMIAVEEDNIVHAAEWALEFGDETGLGIVDSLEDYLELRKLWAIKERLYRLALSQRRQLAAAEPGEYMSDVANTLNKIGELLEKTGRLDDAKPCLQEALRIYRELSLSNPDVYLPETAVILNDMGIMYSQTGHPDDALAYYKEALGIYREFFERYPIAYAENYLMVLRGVMELCKKLGMAERTKEYEQEMEDIALVVKQGGEK